MLANIGFALLAAAVTFHGESGYVAGTHGLVVNAIPQTFMGVLMTVIAILILTGIRLKRAKCGGPCPGHTIWRVFGTALLFAIVSTFICVGLLAFILPKFDVSGMDFFRK